MGIDLCHGYDQRLVFLVDSHALFGIICSDIGKLCADWRRDCVYTCLVITGESCTYDGVIHISDHVCRYVTTLAFTIPPILALVS